MFKFLSSKNIFILSSITTIILFIIVMFIVNPLIDGKNGLEVIYLQLAFNKEIGLNIINDWGLIGIDNFKNYIFFDYLYAFSYATFFTSLIFILNQKTNQKNKIIFLGLIAGLFDWSENSLELFLLNNIEIFPNYLFFIHSVIASLKWLTLPIVLIYIISSLKKLYLKS